MSALHKLYMACVTVLGGMEVVVLDAVPSPVRSDLQTAETLTVGALAVGGGVAFWLAAAFSAGQSGARHRRDDAVAAPSGIPPWADNGRMDVRLPSEAPEPASAVDGPAAVTQVDMAPVVETRETVFGERDRRIAAAWARWDATGEQPAVGDDTQLMPPVDEELPPHWRPPVAGDAPWSGVGLAFMRVEVCEAYDKRHAGARASDPTDWFGMAAERQEWAA